MGWTTVLTALFALIGGAWLTATLALRNARRRSWWERKAEAGVPSVAAHGLAPRLGEPAMRPGSDEQAQAAVPVAVAAGDVDGADKGGGESFGCLRSRWSHGFGYPRFYRFFCRDAAYLGETKRVKSLLFIRVLSEPCGFS